MSDETNGTEPAAWPEPPGTEDANADGPQTPDARPGVWSRLREAHRRSSKWLLYGFATVALLLGLGVGAAAGFSDADEEREHADELASELDATREERDEARDAIDDTRAEAEAARESADDEVAAATEDADEREQRLEERAQELEQRAQDLEERARELEGRAGELDQREQAIAGAEAAAEANSFGDGQYVVGTDIQPGTYRTDGGEFCYWARLSGLSGEFGDIITNDIGPGPKTVNIAASDAAFESDGCGTWTKAG